MLRVLIVLLLVIVLVLLSSGSHEPGGTTEARQADDYDYEYERDYEESACGAPLSLGPLPTP